uniref:Uncharacterized protein n=1 Tax=Rhizobium rhizogenes TaxID=359 RepID=A0A7S4ZS63_RHIRH|nr:hypothetical protein pC5.8d_752 [Rhizobium rhizogenes]
MGQITVEFNNQAKSRGPCALLPPLQIVTATSGSQPNYKRRIERSEGLPEMVSNVYFTTSGSRFQTLRPSARLQA